MNLTKLNSFNAYQLPRLLVFIFFLLLLVDDDVNAQSQCINNYDENKDYFSEKVNVTTAKLFTIEYFKNYKLIRAQNETYALYQCGTPVPEGLPVGTKNFSIPLTSVAIYDSSVIPFLEILGLRSTIKGFDNTIFSIVVSPCLQASKNKITLLDLNNATEKSNLESTFNATFGAMVDPTTPNSVSVSIVSDNGVLNRVEWIKFFSAFFNLESNATKIYDDISNNYNCLKNLANSNASSIKPIIAWTSYIAPSEYNNNTESWTIADAVYKKIFTEDAGATYFNSSTLIYTTSSDFLNVISGVDILIDETFLAPDISTVYKNYGLTKDSNFKFVKNSAIYREDGIESPSGGRDWFEDAVLMNDAVLEDLINVVNPLLPKSDYSRIWLRNVAKNEAIKYSNEQNSKLRAVMVTVSTIIH
ncbi:11859_t:CDS:2 [Diversispora eburnea]|uniref:11859_t:CDS:1 n=1 Tax=Diversispora eburnea TaxID=1213867 RepID=A0A9N8V8A7_9GLOM|nr:11859_t:CDS:2 [Diversispora eburnea]